MLKMRNQASRVDAFSARPVVRAISRATLSPLLCSVSLAALASVLAAGPAMAACTPAPNVDCTGDVSGGVVAPPGTTILNVSNLTTNIGPPALGVGVSAIVINGSGANGGDGVPVPTPVVSFGTDGGDGNNGASFVVSFDGSKSIATVGDNAAGLLAISAGGQGGDGGFGPCGIIPFPPFCGVAIAGDAGKGGNGGNVTVNAAGSITTAGKNAVGIAAFSGGGAGGDGGDVVAIVGSEGGDGGVGGTGGKVIVNSSASIRTDGDGAHGISARSLGGSGGDGGGNVLISVIGVGGSGLGSGPGGSVQVTSSGNIETRGANSAGILAQSIGGFAGGGSSAALLSGLGFAGGSQSAGAGGLVEVKVLGGTITTAGPQSSGIFAQSVGGGGGSGC